jgi:hypothetical protein
MVLWPHYIIIIQRAASVAHAFDVDLGLYYGVKYLCPGFLSGACLVVSSL